MTEERSEESLTNIDSKKINDIEESASMDQVSDSDPSPDASASQEAIDPNPEQANATHATHATHAAHEAEHSKQASKVKKNAIIAIVVLVILLGGGGITLALTANSMIQQGQDRFESIEWPEASQTIEHDGKTYVYNPDVVSVCVIGNDKTRHDPGEDFNGQADAIDVIAVNTKTGETDCITIPRDTMVYGMNTVYGTEQVIGEVKEQLCLVYSHGKDDTFSSENVCRSVSSILEGVPINYYFTIQETAIAEIADAVGGVTLIALDSIPDTNIEGGEEVTLTGNDAMQYILWRDTSYEFTAERRHERQMQFIQALASKVLEQVKANPASAIDLYNVAAAHAVTNLDVPEFSYLVSVITDHGVTSFETHELFGDITRNPQTSWEEVELDPESTLETVLDVYYTEQ